MRRMSLVLGLLLLASTASAQMPAHYRTGADGVLLPDPDATPGVTFLVTVDQLCAPGYTEGVRHVPEAVKVQVYALYGATETPGVCCEVDHLIPLELGGSNALKNLWPQPYSPEPGAREKDVLEDFLHRAVCGGAILLGDAQRQIATDWYKAYLEMKGIHP
jgi:hypothetical protein